MLEASIRDLAVCLSASATVVGVNGTREFLHHRLLVPCLLAALLIGLCAVPAVSAVPRFHGHVAKIDAATRERMVGVSWHPGCPVPLSHLRVLELTHWGFDGEAHRGRLVVNQDSAQGMLAAMHRLFALGFPIRRMHLVDVYGADDHRSMQADNTSAFNCRFVSGTNRWSEHAYGHAIDLNPVENPYADGQGYVSPPAGTPYADRAQRVKGMVHGGGPVVKGFAAIGWSWGGYWEWPKDYQHFSAGGT
jgi:D-alanyl-D-alanine carboxypeptidase